MCMTAKMLGGLLQICHLTIVVEVCNKHNFATNEVVNDFKYGTCVDARVLLLLLKHHLHSYQSQTYDYIYIYISRSEITFAIHQHVPLTHCTKN